MAISLKHAFTSGKPASADSALVDGPKWNDEHDLTLATDKLLGRVSDFTGAAEEVTCTDFAQSLLDDADAATARATLGAAADADLTAHIADATDAHDASAISFTPTGSIAGTDVQTAIQEVRDEAQPLDSDLTAIAALTRTRGDLIVGGAAAWQDLALGTSGFQLQSNGTDAAWAGFLQAGTGAVTRTWQTKARERISPKDFGAVGDGTTDDTAAIQAAITYAATLSDATDSASILDGVFTEIDCSGATWGISSTGIQFTTQNNIVIKGGRFKAIGVWASAAPIFNFQGTGTIDMANMAMRDVTIDCDRKANGIHLEDAPRFFGENIRITHQLEYAIELGENIWGAVFVETVIHEWDSDDANLEVLAQRVADGVRISSGIDVKFIGGFIGFCNRGVACITGGYGVNFIGTHIYDSALVTPQEHDIVFAAAATNGMQFDHCYLDTGWVHLEGTANHVFRDCRFFRNAAIAPAGLTAYIHLEATAASQGLLLRLADCYFDDSAGGSFPVFKLTEAGGDTYVFNKGTFTTAGHDQWTNTLPVNLTCVGATNTPLFLRSTHATQSLLAFAGLSTTLTPEIGADGNALIARVSNVSKLQLAGSVLSPAASDGTALGSGTLMWSDLFLASGGVINFNSGNMTVTHSAGLLAVDGGQTAFNTTAEFGAPLIASSNHAGANYGPFCLLNRESASPAANDNIGAFSFGGRDSGGNFAAYGQVGGRIIDPTDGSEDGQVTFDTLIAGAQATRMAVGAGLMVGGAADPGATNVNVAGAYFVDGTQVVSNRNTGWGAAPTATQLKTTFANGGITTFTQVEQRLSAIINALQTHGVIGT